MQLVRRTFVQPYDTALCSLARETADYAGRAKVKAVETSIDLCWRLKQSPTCGELYCTPGNAGIIVEDGVQVVDVKDSDHAAVVKFCKDNNVGLVVVGPEAPLVDGIHGAEAAGRDAARPRPDDGFADRLFRGD